MGHQVDGESWERAVEQQMRVLRAKPFEQDAYKALHRIYSEDHQYDKSWCLCSAMVFLKKAGAEELQFYELHKPRAMPKARAALSAELWSRVFHPDEDRHLSAIFSLVWPAFAAMHAFTHKEHNLKRKEKLQVPGNLLFANVLHYCAKVLGVPEPELFLVDDGRTADLQLANLIEKDQLVPSVVVRPNLLQGKGERELAFLSARRLTYLRPEYFLKLVLSSSAELEAAMLAAIAVVQPRFPVPPDVAPRVQQYAPMMQQWMNARLLEQLRLVVSRLPADLVKLDLAKWGFAVDHAANRAGFIVSGDLELAARMVAAEPVMAGGPQVPHKVADLVLYSISEDYFAVRQALGLTIG